VLGKLYYVVCCDIRTEPKQSHLHILTDVDFMTLRDGNALVTTLLEIVNRQNFLVQSREEVCWSSFLCSWRFGWRFGRQCFVCWHLWVLMVDSLLFVHHRACHICDKLVQGGMSQGITTAVNFPCRMQCMRGEGFQGQERSMAMKERLGTEQGRVNDSNANPKGRDSRSKVATNIPPTCGKMQAASGTCIEGP
jgi:hypothetical protein